jgi:cytidine kinase
MINTLRYTFGSLIVIINNEESRLLRQATNLIKCAKQIIIISFGPRLVIIKKGSNGALFLNSDDVIISFPAYPIEDIVDPTGAGDSFAGGFIGYIAERNNTSVNTMKEAIAYGIVLGGFAVEGFGVQKLLNITKEDVKRRYESYRSIVKL